MAGSSADGSGKTHRFICTSFPWRDLSCLTAEYLKAIAESSAVLLLLAFFFYRSLGAVLVLSPLMIPLVRISRDRHRERKAEEMRNQFKELMSSILTAMRAGESAENAFRGAYPEMVFLFGKNSPVCRQLRILERGMENHLPLEELLMSFAGSTDSKDVEEIREFAEVFAIARKTGGNMAVILSRTINLIQEKADVENEIRILLSARCLEQHIMDIVPFGIILYIELTAEGYFDPLYHNLSGAAVMSAGLVVYLSAVVLSEKILKIRV